MPYYTALAEMYTYRNGPGMMYVLANVGRIKIKVQTVSSIN